MNYIENCVENHMENFKVCWKPCRKFQSMSKISVTWPLRDPFHQFWNIVTVIKIKSDIINEDYRSLWCYMSSLIEILCVLARKIGFVCWQLLQDLHAMENLFFNLAVNFLYFLSNWVNLLSIFSGIRKLRAFEEIHAFGTDIWAGTAFYTLFWNRTYSFELVHFTF